MKPSWKDAPEWANWLALDEDGQWNWFERMPDRFSEFWGGDVGRRCIAKESDEEWKNSLCEREYDIIISHDTMEKCHDNGGDK